MSAEVAERLRAQLWKAQGRANPLMTMLLVQPVFMSSVSSLLRNIKDPTAFNAAVAFIAALLLFVIAMILRNRWKNRQPFSSSIAFGPSIALRTNGVRETVRWYAVREAFALPDGFAIVRRDAPNAPILIPRSSLDDDGASLWNFLESRLTGESSPLRAVGVPPASRLRNLTDQFLTDSSTLKPAL